MSLSKTDEAINRGEPIRLHRSEFLEKPAEYIIQADDRDAMIELCRYQQVTHAIIPLRLHEGSVFRALYRYDMNKEEIRRLASEQMDRLNGRERPVDALPACSDEDVEVGQVITIRPYKLSEYMKDMRYGPVIGKISFKNDGQQAEAA